MLALTGLYFLSISADVALNVGDVIVMVSAFFWTMHILFIAKYASAVDPIELSMAQIAVCAVLSIAVAAVFETPTTAALGAAWFPVFYGGVMSAGVAFTLQVIGQKYAAPAPAAIIMSFESVFGALASWLFLNEIMTGREIFGCALMFAGVIVTQLPKKSAYST